MARSTRDAKREISHYAHADKERLNNPPVGLVTPDTDHDAGKKTSLNLSQFVEGRSGQNT
jgi:adenine-specific DNA-methyltransferase